MKNKLPLLILVFFACCTSKQKTYIQLKDLKIPLLYDYYSQQFSSIIFNKQFKGHVTLQITKAGTGEKPAWQDSIFYDQSTRTRLRNSSWQQKFTYNELGLCTSVSAWDSRPQMDYSYAYDSLKLTLLCSFSMNGQLLPNTMLFMFDSSGYLYKIAGRDLQGPVDGIFLYDKQKKLVSATFGSKTDSHSTYVASDHYYNHGKLDSVVTNTIYPDGAVQPREVIYVDTTGLPVKKVWSRSATSAHTITYYQYCH